MPTASASRGWVGEHYTAKTEPIKRGDSKAGRVAQHVGPFDTLLAAFHEWDEPRAVAPSAGAAGEQVAPR